jgi:hypothetical protein
MNAMPAWNDTQIKRFLFREALFTRRNLGPVVAESLADRLAFRDYELDARRVCVECSNFQAHKRTCFRGLPTAAVQLIHCHAFEFTKP